MQISFQSLQRIATDSVAGREQWGTSYDFILTVLGYSIGLGNMWRFPYLCYQHGGGTFLFCYIIAAITVGMPYFFLELALGQFMQTGILGVWKICPLFKGVGWAMLVINFYSNVYYIVILTWALLYLVYTIQWPLPWEGCTHEWNTVNCIAAACKGNTCTNLSKNEAVSSVEEFWERRLLQLSGGLEEVGGFQWELVASLYLMWVICYFCLWKGIKWTGKVVYLTVVAPYVLFFIVLFRVIFLPGATDGIKFFLVPKFHFLLDIKVWFAALSQVMYSFGIGFGSLAVLGSYNEYHNNMYNQILIAAIIEIGTNIFFGLVVFSIVGFMATAEDKPLDSVVKFGSELAFIVYPTVALELPGSTLWATLFFLIIITIGIDSEFCCLEGFVTSIMDEFRHIIRGRRQEFLLVVCGIKFFAGLSCVTRGGMYVFTLFDYYAVAGWSIFTAVLFEGCAVAHIYGVNNFYRDLEDMYGIKPSPWWKICWFAISPTIVLVIIIVQLIEYKPLKYHNYIYPVWANAIGWSMSFSSIICIPSYMVYYIATTRGTLKERFRTSIKPAQKLRTAREEQSVDKEIYTTTSKETESSKQESSKENIDKQ